MEFTEKVTKVDSYDASIAFFRLAVIKCKQKVAAVMLVSTHAGKCCMVSGPFMLSCKVASGYYKRAALGWVLESRSE